MCLAVPMRIESIEGEMAVAAVQGVTRQVSLMLLGKAAPGDYVLVHAGFAIQRIDAAIAEETLQLLGEAKAL